jgi:hypothetical protein
MSEDTVIARCPPNDGREWDAQCARCGSSVTRVDCWKCGGEGESAPGELYEQDPLWYDEDDTETCDVCGGTGGWLRCLSNFGDEGPEDPAHTWCETHPMLGRDHLKSGEIEWFELPARSSVPGAGGMDGR